MNIRALELKAMLQRPRKIHVSSCMYLKQNTDRLERKQLTRLHSPPKERTLKKARTANRGRDLTAATKMSRVGLALCDGLLAVALAAAIAMPLAPRSARAQDQSLVPVQVQSQTPAAAQSAAPLPSQNKATRADGNCLGYSRDPPRLGVTSRPFAVPQ